MKNTDTRAYPFAIAAGGMQLLPMAGEKFIIESATGPVDVSWQDGKVLSRQAGQGYTVRGGFTQLVLNNSGAGAITGVIAINDDDAIDNRIAGTVTISGGTTIVPTAPVVGVASTLVLASNSLRKTTTIQNNHATGNIWLGFGVPAVVGVGVQLRPGGGQYDGGMFVHVGAIYAIGDVANALVAVLEG